VSNNNCHFFPNNQGKKVADKKEQKVCIEGTMVEEQQQPKSKLENKKIAVSVTIKGVHISSKTL
jgi:hypothetical protein